MPDWVGPIALYMLHGLELTILLAVLCACASVFLGTLLGIGLVTTVPGLSLVIRLYVELWRGLPLIVILFTVFFALPAFDLRLNAAAAAGVGLSLWGAPL